MSTATTSNSVFRSSVTAYISITSWFGFTVSMRYPNPFLDLSCTTSPFFPLSPLWRRSRRALATCHDAGYLIATGVHLDCPGVPLIVARMTGQHGVRKYVSCGARFVDLAEHFHAGALATRIERRMMGRYDQGSFVFVVAQTRQGFCKPL
jgi:hypothetical protein